MSLLVRYLLVTNLLLGRYDALESNFFPSLLQVSILLISIWRNHLKMGQAAIAVIIRSLSIELINWANLNYYGPIQQDFISGILCGILFRDCLLRAEGCQGLTRYSPWQWLPCLVSDCRGETSGGFLPVDTSRARIKMAVINSLCDDEFIQLPIAARILMLRVF